MSIQRWDIYTDFAGSPHEDKHPTGKWVTHDDHAAEVERLRYVLHRLEQAASEVSNHDWTPSFRRTHAHWSRLHEGIGHARATLAAVGTEGET